MKLTNWLVLISIILLSACGGGSSTSTISSASTFNGRVDVIALAESGDDVYVGGAFTSYNGTAINRIIRLNSDGSIDTNFDVGSGFNRNVAIIVTANDGSGDIYVSADFASYNGTNVKRIIRLNSDGSIDSAFDIGAGFDSSVFSIAVATDGSGDIYAVGQFSTFRGNNRNGLVRINSDGSNDAGFDVGSGFMGDARFIGDTFSVIAATDGSGDIYVGGRFATYRGSTRNGIVRINSDSSIDAGFDVGSGFDGTTLNIFVSSVAAATDGSGDIYAGGVFTRYRGNLRNGIVRINSDSSIDIGFDNGSGFNQAVYSIAVTTNDGGDSYVGGLFTTYNGTASNRLACLESTGLECVNFNGGSGFSGTVYTIAPVNDGGGDIYVGGNFTTYNGTAVGRFVRMDSVGRLK